MKKTFVYISSWIRGGGSGEAGIGVYRMDPAGCLTAVQRVDTAVSFNMTYIDRRNGILYALNETDRMPELRAGGGGRIFVYRIDRDTGSLSLLGIRPTWCANPAYLTLDAAGKFAVVANHGGKGAATRIVQDAFGKYALEVAQDDAVVELFEVRENGTLGELLDIDRHYGSGPEARQITPHPHSAVMSPDGSIFAVCDKGNDTVSMYKIDREQKKLLLPERPWKCRTSSLPRYCVFHPTRPFFYHNNENDFELCAYRYDANGRLTPAGACCAAPDGYIPDGNRQEQQGLCIRADGSVLYDVVRGPNTVAVLDTDPETGAVRLGQSVEIPDSWPRGCALSEDGRFLIVCGLGSGKVFVLEADGNGRLKDICGEYAQTFAAYASVWTVQSGTAFA